MLIHAVMLLSLGCAPPPAAPTDDYLTKDFASGAALSTTKLTTVAQRNGAYARPSELTRGIITRNGANLASNEQLIWDLTLKDAPVFRAHIAVDGPPTSPPVTLTLRVTNHRQTVVHTVDVAADIDTFIEWSVDVSAFANQSVTLSIDNHQSTPPATTASFIGSPMITTTIAQTTVRHVIVVGLDTTRPDRFGVMGYQKPTSDTLDAALARFSIADRAWSPAPRTRPSFRAALTGRHPLAAVGATNIGAVFHDNQFVTGAFAANLHLNPRFGFDDGFDMWQLDHRAASDSQVDKAIRWLDDNRHADAFLFLHLMDPHIPYTAPQNYIDRFVTDPHPAIPDSFIRSQVYGWLADDHIDSQSKQHIADLYDAEIAFMADQLARLITAIDAMDTTTLILIHSDHGEELFEHGGFEHNHTLTDETTKAVMWLRVPGQSGGRYDAPTTLVDIAPTLFDFAGFLDTPPTDGRSLRPFVSSTGSLPDWSDRPIGLGHMRYGHQRWGVVLSDHKYILHTLSGQEELYDLNSPDGESNNIASESDLAPYQTALGDVHQMIVSRGLRVDYRLVGSQPVHVTFETPITHATVLPRDAMVEHPVNQAWGIKAPYSTDDMARISVSTDQKTLLITPGVIGEGTVALSFGEGPVSPDFWVGTETEQHHQKWSNDVYSLSVRAGTVVHPPSTEAQRMEEPDQTTNDAHINHLISLGYITAEE